MISHRIGIAWVVLLMAISPDAVPADELGTHGFAPSGDIKIHYVTKGEGPLVILVHGFPDFWYSWRHQMPALSKHFQVVAVDLRGYNESGQPEGEDQYRMDKLVGDLVAVLDHFQRPRATIVGHDWGGAIAWSFAMTHAERTERLVVLNLPHPWGLQRELATNPQQAENSKYARDFQEPGAEKRLTASGLAQWVQDAEARQKYVEAFEKSSFAAMLNYYRANYPRAPYAPPAGDPPPVNCPVLAIHGLKDPFLLSSALNDNWKWVARDYTLVTLPDASHFVQHDKPEFVTKTMLAWLLR